MRYHDEVRSESNSPQQASEHSHQELHGRAEVEALEKKQLFDLMIGLGFVLVVVEFDGYGDEGVINEMTAYKKIDEYGEGYSGDGPPFDLMPFTETQTGSDALARATQHLDEIKLATAVEAFTYERLPSGWGNDEGSYGTIYFRPADQEIDVEYCQRCVEFTEYNW